MICKEDYENTKSAIDVIAKGEGDRSDLIKFESLVSEAGFGFSGCSFQKHAQRLLDILEYAEHKNDDRLMPEGTERPKFEDGEPVKVGDEFERNGKTVRIVGIHYSSCSCYLNEKGGGQYYYDAPLKRPEPKQDTLQDVIDDFSKGTTEYWKCSTIPCLMCPSKINGKTPQDYYGIMGCDIAKIHDIKRRLKAIQERMGGDQ